MSVEYVDFPALGLRIPVVRTLFKLFGQDIYTYAVIIALSIVLMIVLGLRHSERYGIKQDFIIDFMIFALPASIICARLYYVIFTWDNYKGNLLSIFNIRQGGIAIYGSVIGAFLTVIIFSKIKKESALKFLDFGVPYLLLAQGIGRWGNFVNQEVFGTNTTLPWGMTSNRIAADLAYNANWLSSLGITVDPLMPVHPTFLYESFWNILVACFLFWLRRRRKYKGEVLLGYLIGYGAGRAFIEGIRTDSLMLGGIRISQLVSVLIVVAGLFVVIFLRGVLKRYDDEPVAAGADDSGAGAGEAGDEDADEVEAGAGDEGEAEEEAEAGDEGEVEAEAEAGDEGEVEADVEAGDEDKAEAEIEDIIEQVAEDKEDSDSSGVDVDSGNEADASNDTGDDGSNGIEADALNDTGDDGSNGIGDDSEADD